MKKSLGILVLFVVVFVLTAIFNPNFIGAYNLQNLLLRSSMFAIIGIGAALVIITGGIDLSIGSVIGLTGCLLPWLLTAQGWPTWAALLAIVLVSLAIGATHGLLITRLRLQPFVVTLCGLLVYRGVARWFTGDKNQGFGEGHELLLSIEKGRIPLGNIPGIGNFQLPVPFVLKISPFESLPA